MKNFTLVILSIFTFSMNAQIDYQLTVSNEAYENLVDAVSLNQGMVWDDPAYTIPIGFDFLLGSITTSTLFISEDGVGGLVSTNELLDVPGTGAFGIVLQDIVDRGDGTSTSLSPISYLLDDTGDHRILKIEWNNCGFFDNLNLEDFINFQLWLYEDSNVIEYRFGPSSINNQDDSYQGLSGLQTALFPMLPDDDEEGDLEENSYTLTGEPSNPDFVVLTTRDEFDDAEFIALTGSPSDGTVYRFQDENLSVDTFALSTIQLYPNPTNGIFEINSESAIDEVVISNSLGQKLKTLNGAVQKFDITDLPKGVYFINVLSNMQSYTKKLIKN